MVLVDTSVWIEHFRHGTPELAANLEAGIVLIHPWVSAELACGNLKDREKVLSHLNALPAAKIATGSEALQMLEDRRLWGRGLGWVDVNLLASALLTGCALWTRDKQLGSIAAGFGLN